MYTYHSHKTHGQSIIVLVLIIAFFVVGALALFGFEVHRLTLAREQLIAACDAASLAGAATLASQDNVDPVDAHDQAMNTVLTTFQQNSVLGMPLSDAQLGLADLTPPGAGHSTVTVEFLDPHNNNQPVDLGDPAGKIVRVSAVLGLEPAFGRFLGFGVVPVRAKSSGGVPDLDVVLAFDVSGSIDDQTPVTFVRRQWSSAQARIVYVVPPVRPGAKAGPLAQGRIYDILGPRPTGTRVNAIFPQYLGSSNTSDIRWPLTFSEKSGSPGAIPGLRGASNSGAPPGNQSTGNPLSDAQYRYTYTDLVVNIDGNETFQGISVGGYDFPDLATLVEAARGNLENGNVFHASKADTGVPPAVWPRAGYQAKYFELARANIHPLGDAQKAASDFFTIMNTNTDGHFGLVAFSDNGGTSPTSGYTASNVDTTYGPAGTGRFPIPQIVLEPADLQTNFEETLAAISPTVATTGTNIGDAVLKAVNQLKTKSRPGAKKAIVLFTDGMPTVGGPLDSDPWRNARKAAVECKKAGIPLYTIGLAQNPEIVPDEVAILNDTNPNPASGGMAAIAGNGGKFFLVTDVGDLRRTFEHIARQLVQLVR